MCAPRTRPGGLRKVHEVAKRVRGEIMGDWLSMFECLCVELMGAPSSAQCTPSLACLLHYELPAPP